MTQPNNHTPDLPQEAQLIPHSERYVPSAALVDLMVEARSGYDWPAGTGAARSQQTIQEHEALVERCLAALNAQTAHTIVVRVSDWAGNNTNSHAAILGATSDQQGQMQNAIKELLIPGHEASALDELCSLPGVSLVIASKIFRFCSPKVGAAVDRHASYFFNSLPIANQGKASHFVREWSNGRHTGSRLAIYSRHNYMRNRIEYIDNYLPLLAKIAIGLNELNATYCCAASGQKRYWTPADVEMAAYYWWACNGSR